MLLPEKSPITQPPATTAGLNPPPVSGPTAMAPAMTVVPTEGEQELGEQHHRGIAPGRCCGVAAGIDEEVGQDRPEQCSNQLRRPVEEQVSRCEAASDPDGEAHGGGL